MRAADEATNRGGGAGGAGGAARRAGAALDIAGGGIGAPVAR